MREVASAMRLERRRAVRADDPEILEPVVGRDAVDVVEDQRHARAAPQLVLAAHLAAALLDALRIKTPLEVPPVVRGVGDEEVLERPPALRGDGTPA